MTSPAPTIDQALGPIAAGYERNLVFYVNGQRHEIEHPDPKTLLVDFLRSTAVGLTGTKHCCGQGGCGACTVTLSRYDVRRQAVVHLAGNSCLRPLCALDGMLVTTIEGLGSVNTTISPVQYQVATCNGSQCGYCTPGFVMNMHSYLLQNEGRELSRQAIQDAFDGNICRCTGFRPILFAMKHFATDGDPTEAAGTPPCLVDPSMDVAVATPRADFPEALKTGPRPVAYRHRCSLWVRPLSLAHVHELLRGCVDYEVRLVIGNTSTGIPDVIPRHPTVFVDIAHLPELHGFDATADHLVVGAAVTYTDLLDHLDDMLRQAPAERAAGLSALRYMVGRTAGTIVRNLASLAGNTMLVARNAVQGGTPFPSDAFTALCALGAQIVAQTAVDDPLPPMGMLDFVARYTADAAFRQQVVILHYQVPYTSVGDHVTTYKVARREVNAHAIVNAGLRVGIDARGTITQATLVFGAIAPVAFQARQTEQFLIGKPWTAATYEQARGLLRAELRQIQHDLPEWFRRLPSEGVTGAYRVSLAESFFYKFYVEVSDAVDPGSIDASERSAGVRYVRGVSWGSQTFAAPSEGPSAGQPFIKLSAFEQTTGEAIYTQDLPVPVRGVYGSFVTSTAANADFSYHITSADGVCEPVDTPALVSYLRDRFAGEFVAYITGRDIPPGGINGVLAQKSWPPDPWFCEGSATCFGQSIGLVVATTEVGANTIAAFVREQCISYTHHDDVVLDIDYAVTNKQFFGDYDQDDNHSLQTPGYALHNQWVGLEGRIDVDRVLCEVVSGRQYTGAQAHFYLETQSCLALPGEGPEMVVHSSTQSPTTVQDDVKQTLAVPANCIEVDIKRLGGAYGGKTTRSPFVAAPAALAAATLKRPVRVAMARDVDTWMIGGRHPFRGDYSLAIACDGDQKGRILGSSTTFYSDGGNTRDCSFDVMDCAQLGADNAYRVPYFFTRGEVCQTNTKSNGAMRSYGGIQAMLIQEDALEQAAYRIGMLPENVRELNLYQPGDKTPFGQTLDYCYIREVWERLKQRSSFTSRVAQVQAFNAKNRWRKRGISMIPLKYGLGYNLGYLMQGGALVDVYSADGTVLIRTGGVEMGQGILTKVAQVAASELNVPLRLIRMGSTLTSIIPDSFGTGATSGTDLSGGAAKAACRKLRESLEALCWNLLKQHGADWCRDQGVNFWDYPEDGWRTEVTMPGKSGKTLMWNNVVSLALQNRVDLASQALYSTPGLVNSTDQQFYGFTYSAACSEVEIDVLTGETTVLRADICYDMGQSINPAIDIGQIEGAFVMGIGNVLTEEVVFQPDGPTVGSNNTANTWTYKPPATTTIPLELHVDLFPRDDASGPRNPNLLMGSKGVGEPPLVLAATVYFAVKHAVLAARHDRQIGGWFLLKSPATVERVSEACAGGFEATTT